jgi:hypothetical protein
VRLISADEMNPHHPVGEDTVRIPMASKLGHVDLCAFHAAGIPSIIISPQTVKKRLDLIIAVVKYLR